MKEARSNFVTTSHCCPSFMQHPRHMASANLATEAT